jgi:hypothetical protein
VDQASLETLCRQAESARGSIERCWLDNTGTVKAQITAYEWILGRAGASDRWHGDLGETLACVASGAADLRRVRGQEAKSSQWVESALAKLGEAQTCWGLYGSSTAELRKQLGQDLSGADRCLGEVPTADFALPMSLDEIAGELERLGGRARELESLLSTGAEDPDGLRAELGKLGVTVSAATWNRLNGLDELPSTRNDVLATIRDEAVNDELAAMMDTSRRWAPIGRTMSPFLDLHDAFERFGAGDLDGAILALRSGPPRCAVSGEQNGRGEALRHASLAYFLYLKSRVHDGSEDARVADILEEDARHEALRAADADRGFALPATLFPNDRFRGFFEKSVGAELTLLDRD